MTRRDDWFITASGRRFFVLEPDPAEVCIEDIAHALSHVCRFGGHCRTFYSVAQHSVHVSRLVPSHLARWGLMHDATEAYVGDVIRPLKRQLRVYAEIESRVEEAIIRALGLPRIDIDDITALKRADVIALATERRDVHVVAHSLRDSFVWHEDELGVEPDPEPIAPLPPTGARELFLARARELGL